MGSPWSLNSPRYLPALRDSIISPISFIPIFSRAASSRRGINLSSGLPNLNSGRTECTPFIPEIFPIKSRALLFSFNISGPVISTSKVLLADRKMGLCMAKAKRYPGISKISRPISLDLTAIFTSPRWPAASSFSMMAPPPLKRDEKTRKLRLTSSIATIFFSYSAMYRIFVSTGVPATGSMSMNTMSTFP